MSIEEMYQSKLLDKLKEKFSDNELDLGLRGGRREQSLSQNLVTRTFL
jgi:hypothetical protein